MRRSAILLVVLALSFMPSLAAVQTIVINDKVYLPNGQVAISGSITAELSQAGSALDLASGIPQAVGGRISATIDPNGRPVGLELVANQIITPANTHYRVTFSARSSTSGPLVSWSWRWNLRSSPNPVSVGAVPRLDPAPAALAGLDNLADVDVAGATVGQCIVKDTDGIWRNSSSCGGAGGGHAIKSGGSAVTPRANLNFSGGLRAVDNSGTAASDASIDPNATIAMGDPSNPGVSGILDLTNGDLKLPTFVNCGALVNSEFCLETSGPTVFTHDTIGKTGVFTNRRFTTKGDLWAATGSNAGVRVGAGPNGSSLIADSAQASGVRYRSLQVAGSSIGALAQFNFSATNPAPALNGLNCFPQYDGATGDWSCYILQTQITRLGTINNVVEWSGTLNFSGASVGIFIPPQYTVATLPPATTAGRTVQVTDASVAGSCTSGGGSARSWCRANGSTWDPIGDGGSGGSGVGSSSADQLLVNVAGAVGGYSWLGVTPGTQTLNVGTGGVVPADPGDGLRMAEFPRNSIDVGAPSSGNLRAYAKGTSGSEHLFLRNATNGVIAILDTFGGDYGDITCSAGLCAADADSIALGTDTTGNYAGSSSEGGAATTATALAANGTNCSAGNYPLGVDASGNVESCTSAAGGSADNSRQLNYYRQVGTSPERLYAAGYQGGTLTQGGFTTGVYRATPYFTTRGGTIDRIGIRVTTGSASTNFRLCIYDSTSDTNLYPNNLVLDAGSLSSVGTGFISATVSQALTANSLYWFAFENDSATPQFRSITSGPNQIPIMGFANPPTTDQGVGWTVAHTFGACPSTFPASGTVLEAASIPAVMVRYSN